MMILMKLKNATTISKKNYNEPTDDITDSDKIRQDFQKDE